MEEKEMRDLYERTLREGKVYFLPGDEFRPSQGKVEIILEPREGSYTLEEIGTKVQELFRGMRTEEEKRTVEKEEHLYRHGLKVLESEGKVYLTIGGCMGCGVPSKTDETIEGRSKGIDSVFDEYLRQEGDSALKGKDVILFGSGTVPEQEDLDTYLEEGKNQLLEWFTEGKPADKEPKIHPVWKFNGSCEETVAIMMAKFKVYFGAKSVTYVHFYDRDKDKDITFSEEAKC